MVTEYLDYLWELGELPVYIIGGDGIAWEPGSNGLAIACTWGSSVTVASSCGIQMFPGTPLWEPCKESSSIMLKSI